VIWACATVSKVVMQAPNASLLTINGGSSSIRFAIYRVGEGLTRQLSGKIDRLGQSDAVLTARTDHANTTSQVVMDASDVHAVVNAVIDWLQRQPSFASVRAIGHRIVHGRDHHEPEVFTQALLDDLRLNSASDPEHLPLELELIEGFRQRFPDLQQVTCFDTAFHADLPLVARMLPLPRHLFLRGVRRYGFHGISYTFLLEELVRLGDPAAKTGRVILAHLGSGASLAAVRDGHSIDTSMGFTPTGGVPMSTRSGDLDPGVAAYVMATEHLTVEQFQHLVNHESGLIGIAETSGNMQHLLTCESQDPRAAEAVAMFCYQVKKCIGAFAAALGGVDTLVFSGGIGEHAAVIRERICSGLEFIGIDLDLQRNVWNDSLISKTGSRVSVRVIATDEELMIARSVIRVQTRQAEPLGFLSTSASSADVLT
jgi:acetate kinase